MATCQKCGFSAGPHARVCSQCGTKLPGQGSPAKTMLGMVSPLAQTGAHSPASKRNESATPQPPAAAPVQNPSAARGSNRVNLGGTMLGMPAPRQLSPEPPTEPPAQAGPAPATQASREVPAAAHSPQAAKLAAAAHSPQPAKASAQSPLAGTQIAGTAPLGREPQAAPGPSMQTPTPKVGEPQLSSANSPAQAQAPQNPAFAPHRSGEAPVPSVALRAAAASANGDTSSTPRPLQSSVPIQARLPVAKPNIWPMALLLLGGLLAAGGIGALVARLKERPVHVVVTRFSVDDHGDDQLDLMCPDCPDDSVLLLGAAKTKFQSGRAVFHPAQPLAIGDNEFKFTIRNSEGKKLKAKELHVEVPFRLRSNWKGMHASPPYGEIIIDAPQGSTVLVGKKPAELIDGHAVFPVTIDEQSLGESRTATNIDLTLPVAVTHHEQTKTAKASLHGTVLPLQLNSVGPVHQLFAQDVTITGVTLPHVKVKIGEQEVESDQDGHFAIVLEKPEPASLMIEVRGDQSLTRRVPLELTKSAKISPEAITKFDKIGDGAEANFSGLVLESRIAAGVTETLMQVDNGCAHPPCLVRSHYAEPRRIAPNRRIRVAGWVTPGDPAILRVSKFH